MLKFTSVRPAAHAVARVSLVLLLAQGFNAGVALAQGAMQALLADGRLKFDGAEVNTIDGLRVDWSDGFGLIRGSNTTPVLVLRFEGHTQDALHRIEATMMAALKSVKPDAKIAAAAH